MAHPICPECSTEYVRRVRRKGIADLILSLLYRYPFSCQLCGHRFRSFQRGVKYLRIEEEQRAYERLPVSFPVTFASATARGRGQAAEISMSSCTIQAEHEVAAGTVCRLSLQIARDRPAIIIDVAIARNVQHNRIGFEFLRMEAAAREQLQAYMRRLLLSQPMTEGTPLDRVAEFQTVNWTL